MNRFKRRGMFKTVIGLWVVCNVNVEGHLGHTFIPLINGVNSFLFCLMLRWFMFIRFRECIWAVHVYFWPLWKNKYGQNVSDENTSPHSQNSLYITSLLQQIPLQNVINGNIYGPALQKLCVLHWTVNNDMIWHDMRHEYCIVTKS